MFENIIEQTAVSQIKEDIKSGNLAQSMLFFGPSESAKASTALELARVLSCEKKANWTCDCSSCNSHRFLQNEDLLVLGKRNFYAEIAANSGVFLKNPSEGTKLLYYRSLRKLQIRFSPHITEDDPKIAKISSLIQSFDEKINDFYSLKLENVQDTVLEKTVTAINKDALSLEEDGLSINIPISHIRKASYWCRLAPNGKRKILIIENADNMRDEARNSLLKLLEEPPPSVSIILTSGRKEAIIPTILSRLRPYRFLKRSIEAEKEILRRVFQAPSDFTPVNQDNIQKSLISAYLDSFTEASSEKLFPLAQWFVSLDFKENSQEITKNLLAKSNNFENDSFSRFLKLCLELMSEQIRNAKSPEYIFYFDLYKKYINEAVTACDVLNQSVTLVLESLLFKLKTKMDKCYLLGESCA